MKLQGVLPALVTPFDAFKAHLPALRVAGVKGWVPCGSSGECNFLTDDARDQVLLAVPFHTKPTQAEIIPISRL